LSKDASKLFYVSRFDFLYIVDIKEIDKPKVLSKLELLNINDIILSKDENRLYLNCRDQLDVFDISDKSNPKKLDIKDDFYEKKLLKNQEDWIKKVKGLDFQASWRDVYERIKDIEFTPNGKYFAYIANKNNISFKKIEVMLPVIDEDSLYNKDDYFGNYYSAVVEPDIDEIKEIIISTDGTKLFAFSSSDLFVYDISQLK
jgi:hypothetical protein